MSKQPTPGVHENMAEALASPAEVVETPPPGSHKILTAGLNEAITDEYAKTDTDHPPAPVPHVKPSAEEVLAASDAQDDASFGDLYPAPQTRES